jgi:hypothetical protein
LRTVARGLAYSLRCVRAGLPLRLQGESCGGSGSSKIVYLPVSRVEDYASSFASDLPLPALPAPVLDEVLRKAEELYALLKEREECVWALTQASKLLNEKRISPTTYREVTWRHMRRLAVLSERVEKLSGVRAFYQKLSCEHIARWVSPKRRDVKWHVTTIVFSVGIGTMSEEEVDELFITAVDSVVQRR